MHHLLEQLMTEYEEGRCDRRQLLVALAALMTTGATHAIAPSPAPQFRGRELNHVTLRVADLGRSKEFYAKLLGLPVIKEDKAAGTCYFGIRRSFVSLWQSDGPGAGFDHWCVGVQPFTRTTATTDDGSRATIRRRLEDEGYSLRKDPDDPTIYVRDPDGHVVQLEAPGFKP